MTTYTISDLSREFRVTPRTLRFYEEKGMLRPARIGQRRLYNQADRVRLSLILRGKRLGFTLEESFAIISMYNPRGSNVDQLERLVEKIREKREHLREQQREIRDMLRELDGAAAGYMEAISALQPVPARARKRG